MSWMTPAEYADYRNISLSKANKDRVTGNGPPYVKTGGVVRYDSRRVEEWLASHERRSTSEPARLTEPIAPPALASSRRKRTKPHPAAALSSP